MGRLGRASQGHVSHSSASSGATAAQAIAYLVHRVMTLAIRRAVQGRSVRARHLAAAFPHRSEPEFERPALAVRSLPRV